MVILECLTQSTIETLTGNSQNHYIQCGGQGGIVPCTFDIFNWIKLDGQLLCVCWNEDLSSGCSVPPWEGSGLVWKGGKGLGNLIKCRFDFRDIQHDDELYTDDEIMGIWYDIMIIQMLIKIIKIITLQSQALLFPAIVAATIQNLPPHNFTYICETQPSSIHRLSSLIFPCLSVRPATVTSPLISTVRCFRPYKPYIFWKLLVQGYQNWYYQVSHAQIHKYKYTNTQIQHINSAIKTHHVAYFWKEHCSRIPKMIFPCVKHANTKI